MLRRKLREALFVSVPLLRPQLHDIGRIAREFERRLFHFVVAGFGGRVQRQLFCLLHIKPLAGAGVPVLRDAGKIPPAVLDSAAGPVLRRAFHSFHIVYILRAHLARQIHRLGHVARGEQDDRRVGL